MNLYNKYRPHSLASVAGQEQVKKPLAMMVQSGDIPHSLLFTGPAGTGKTTCARILAAMVNCTDGPKVEYAADDPVALAIISGRTNIDVYEMDAASNRGIDEIKALREKAYNVPMEMRRKIYIIDECHQLTPEAWNALLKLIEEPPSHAMFVLCTTEKRKVIETIQSRCVCFEFRSLSMEDVVKQLRFIASAEKIDIEDDAIRMIASVGRGSLRTSISKMEKLRQSQERITGKLVSTLLGTTSRQTVANFIEAVANGNLLGGLTSSSEAISVGVPPEDFFSHVATFCHDLIFLGVTGYDIERTGYTPDELQALTKVRDKLIELVGKTHFRPMILQWISYLNEYSISVVYRMQPQFLVNIAFTKLYYNLKSYKNLHEKGGAA